MNECNDYFMGCGRRTQSEAFDGKPSREFGHTAHLAGGHGAPSRYTQPLALLRLIRLNFSTSD